MKPKNFLLPLVAALALCWPVSAADKKAGATDRAPEKKVAGPNGGRILAKVDPRAEFFVMPDRKVQITFLDQAGKAIAPAEQVVTVTAGDRLSPSTLTFAKMGNRLVSNIGLPKGEEIPAVVQIKSSAQAAMVTEKFNVDLATCGECKLAEYACTCSH